MDSVMLHCVYYLLRMEYERGRWYGVGLLDEGVGQDMGGGVDVDGSNGISSNTWNHSQSFSINVCCFGDCIVLGGWWGCKGFQLQLCGVGKEW